ALLGRCRSGRSRNHPQCCPRRYERNHTGPGCSILVQNVCNVSADLCPDGRLWSLRETIESEQHLERDTGPRQESHCCFESTKRNAKCKSINKPGGAGPSSRAE